MIRELKTKDIFKMSKILKKLNLKLETEGKTQTQLGTELILAVVENLYIAESDVYEFLADLAGLKVEEFSELPIEETFKIIDEVKNIPFLASFLKRANQ